MKVAVLSLQLHTNYGGILQSYALKTTLQRMGYEVEVLNKPVEWDSFPYLPFCVVKRWLERKFGKYKGPIFLYRDYPKVSRFVSKFIDDKIEPRNISSFKEIKPIDYDAFVVGSDQVWRPSVFADNQWQTSIADAFLQFAKDWRVKRIAYAASFGVDTWEYDDVETKQCAALVRGFDGVSVREESAVKLCSDYFSVQAQCLIDPTLLLSIDDYVALLKNEPQSLGNMFVYMLDDDVCKQSIVNAVSNTKGLIPYYVSKKKRNPFAVNVRPKVETWLKCLMDADFVVTDSYHACLFAILFSKPFIVVGNVKRGMARFSSLIEQFHLRNNLLTSLDEYRKDYDYKPVNTEKILAQKKEEAVAFLRRYLG